MIINRNMIKIRSYGEGKGFVWVKDDDMMVVACYFSPNREVEDFENMLECMNTIPINGTKRVIFGADLNAKIVLWGYENEDEKGRILSEWINAHDMYVLNTGNVPTYRSGDRRSIVDVTICTISTV